MEVFLYNSTVCRLCGEENDSGTLLYSSEENTQNLSEIINTYLPIKVSDDGQLPRTICPGCTIQLEATVEFLNLIINGQKIIRELHQREKEYKKTIFKAQDIQEDAIADQIVYDINSNDGVYQEEHPISLQVSGLERPKRKRGRPPKKQKSPEEIAKETAAREYELAAKQQESKDEVPGKRRRKTPTRFKEAVQGKELERIFKEEGVTDGDDSENETKAEINVEPTPSAPKEPEIIGHMETSGELVVVVKGKGRGRPKGRMRLTRSQCAICGAEFSCVGRYMSHVAQHGPVLYRCACADTFATRVAFQQHQLDTAHQGQTVIACSAMDNVNVEVEVKTEEPSKTEEPDPPALSPDLVADIPMASLPDLSDKTKDDTTDFIKSLVSEREPVTSEPNSNLEQEPKNDEKAADKVDESAEIIDLKGKLKLKCPHCEKMFGSKQSKSMHIKAVHQGEKPYACGECGVRFAYPRSLALHALSHRRHRAPLQRRYACDLCGKVLNHPSSVVYHKEAEHAGQRYVCNKCGKSFKHKQLLQRHQLVHSQLRPYNCKICNASFKTKANLINHQLLHSGIKKFSCEICKHKFAHKTSLTLHMRWHTGSKPFVCKICGKSFSQKGNLSEHERIHTGEKPYQCSVCSRRFTTSSQYRLHARRHQPERPYACAHCPKRFVSRGGWAAHVRRSAGPGEAPPARPRAPRTPRRAALACPHCPRTFNDPSNLNKHKKQVHKQISLLVNGNNQQQQIEIQQVPEERDESSILEVASVPSADNEMEERVIYVTYDVDESEPAFHILDPEQAATLDDNKVLTTCELYSGPSLLVSQPELETLELEQEQMPPDQLQMESDLEPLELGPDEHIAVTDEQGNPLHFTMQDGTQLAITSSDGKSLQVVTQDGQTIPVEINGFNAEEEEVEEETETVTQINQSKGVVDGNGASAVTHYFTIV